MDKERVQEAKNYAFSLLSYRERSRQEIKLRLLKKDFAKDVAEKVVADLSRLDYLNDYRFARKWVKDRINHKPRGSYLLKHELREKGIDNHIINKILSELLDKNLKKDMAYKLARKWLKKNRKKKNYYLKLKRYLSNKGFSSYIINEVVDTFVNDSSKIEDNINNF